jgi:osmoprotectant transport system ATP-binding protein
MSGLAPSPVPPCRTSVPPGRLRADATLYPAVMLRLVSVTKRYADGTVAVDDLSLQIESGEICMLVGPSGSGKTTTMRMINRLIEPTSGQIFLEDRDVTHVNPVELRRQIGYVIQNVGLFPHLTVADNVGAVPRLLGWDKARIRRRTAEMLELVGLDPERHGKRYPAELSGGQRQRAGVARALAADPPVLLMDEPFGAIDPITRDRLQGEFMRLQQELRKTVVFVTHDIEEAVRLGDRIAVLADGGRLEQYDTPAQILGSPRTPFVAEFVGSDRGLKRLSVTEIEPSDLERPPLVSTTDTLEEARAAFGDDQEARWAVVIDPDGRLQGWLGRDELSGSGSLDARVHRMRATVPVGASLKQAFSEMLQRDAGWVAVLDGERYLGVLTPDSLHAALRRSVGRAEGEAPEPSVVGRSGDSDS